MLSLDRTMDKFLSLTSIRIQCATFATMCFHARAYFKDKDTIDKLIHNDPAYQMIPLPTQMELEEEITKSLTATAHAVLVGIKLILIHDDRTLNSSTNYESLDAVTIDDLMRSFCIEDGSKLLDERQWANRIRELILAYALIYLNGDSSAVNRFYGNLL